MTLRTTTRIGACIRCGGATMTACIGCERFVCTRCEAEHDEVILDGGAGGGDDRESR